MGRLRETIRRRSWASGVVTGGVAVAVVTAGGLAIAAIPSSSGEITGCARKDTGAVRVIDAEAGQKCTRKERTLRWSSGWRYMGAWSGGTSYRVNDVVQHEGSTYLAKRGTKGDSPAEIPASWGLLAAAGSEGPQGPSGVVRALPLNGPLASIGATTNDHVMGATTQTVTLQQGEWLSATAAAALGHHGSSNARVSVDICYQQTDGPVVNMSGTEFGYALVGPGPLSTQLTASGVASPGPGTYEVGMCVLNPSTQALDANDFVNGNLLVFKPAG